MLIPQNDAIFLSHLIRGPVTVGGNESRQLCDLSYSGHSLSQSSACTARTRLDISHEKNVRSGIILTLSYHLTRGFILAIVMHEDESESGPATRAGSGNRRTF